MWSIDEIFSMYIYFELVDFLLIINSTEMRFLRYALIIAALSQNLMNSWEL